MTATREAIEAQARTWLGTPWAHQGRAKGVGADCVGFIAGALAELGEDVHDFTWYSRAPEGDALLREVASRFVKLERPEPGALLVFWVRKRGVAQHVGLLTAGNTILHGNAAARVVCEQPYDARWRDRTMAAFDLTRRAEPRG